MGLRRDRPPPAPVETRLHPRRRPRSRRPARERAGGAPASTCAGSSSSPSPTDRVWMRDYGPTILVDGAGGRRGDSTGTSTPGRSTTTGSTTTRVAGRMAEHLGCRCAGSRWRRRPARRAGGRQHRRQRRGAAADDGGVPAQRRAGAQPRPVARGHGASASRDYLGVRKVLWLGRGIAGDDTHGHVDDLARFVGPRTVVTVVEDDPRRREPRAAAREPGAAAGDDGPGRPAAGGGDAADAGAAVLRRPAAAGELRELLHRQRAWCWCRRSTTPRDRVALATLAELFPGREVVGIHAVDLVWGLGTLHCLTQQEPAGGER